MMAINRETAEMCVLFGHALETSNTTLRDFAASHNATLGDVLDVLINAPHAKALLAYEVGSLVGEFLLSRENAAKHLPRAA